MNHKERDRLIIVETNQKHILKKVDKLCGDVEDILENHLPHMSSDIGWLKWGFMAIAAALLALLFKAFI